MRLSMASIQFISMSPIHGSRSPFVKAASSIYFLRHRFPMVEMANALCLHCVLMDDFRDCGEAVPRPDILGLNKLVQRMYRR